MSQGSHSLFSELKRRNVFRVAIAYLAAAWLLIEVTDTVFPYFGLGEVAVRILIVLLAIGFPLFLVFSWLYELTPEGLKLEKDVDRTGPAPRAGTTRLDRVIIVLLALALGYFAVDKFVLEPVRVADIVEEATEQARSAALVESYGEKSIAVMPFVNLSADPEQAYFSDGISEEILNLLAQIPELRVISRSSAFSFKGKDIAIPEVAKQLNVAHVLEGSVRRAGERVRVTAQLIEARSDTHLWSQTYDRTLDDIFAVQDEIAAAISTALKMEFALVEGQTAQPAAITAGSTAAYDAYLQARALMHHRNRDSMEEAVDQLERAVRLDDGFAPAHAQLAMATMLLSTYVKTDRQAARRTALHHLDRAEMLEPDLAEMHAGRALLAQYANDPESTILHAKKALALNPNYIDAMHWLRIALLRFGRYEEAHTVLEQMLEIDPLSIVARRSYALWLMNHGRIEEAHELADGLLELSPQASYVLHSTIAFWGEGKLTESLFWALQASPVAPSGPDVLALVGEYDEARRISTNHWIDVNQGRWEAAIEVARRNVELYPDSGIRLADAAEVLYHAGRLDEALPLYERANATAPKGRPIANFGPYFTVQLAVARLHAGDEEGAKAAVQLARQDHAARRAGGEVNPVLSCTEAMIAAFEHDSARSLAALDTAIQRGLRWPMFFDDPVFESLRDDNRFIRLRQNVEALVAEEHEKVLQLICFNNPVPEEWQPMPETCEGMVQKPSFGKELESRYD
jgi:TolB-like protein/Flp pilus assembly protein TadD